MLSFSTNLTNEIRDRHASAYWYVKLYYGSEASFTGLSDSDRVLNGVKYRGLVLDWGGWAHSANLNEFKPSTAALNNLTISNKDDAISGGRFSDLFSSQNYVNRKFTLHMGAVGVAFADHAQIAQGIITDQVKQNSDTLTLRLIENLSSVSLEVPKTRVTSAVYPNAPVNNLEKPIPMAYGDFGLATAIGTIPTSGAEFDRYFVKSHYPAIITDQWDETNANVVCSPDSVTMSELRAKNVFYRGSDKFSPCEDANVTETEATPEITFKGETWRAYIPLQKFDTYDSGNYANTIDSAFNTSYTFTCPLDTTTTTGWRIPKIPKLGEFVAFKIMFDFGTFTSTPAESDEAYPFFLRMGASEFALTWNDGEQTETVTSAFTAAKRSAWDFEAPLLMLIDDTGISALVDKSVVINQVGIEIEFTPSQTFTKEYFTTRWQPGGVRNIGGILFQSPGGTVRVTNTATTPEVSDYIYYSGKGREYGDWIDTINATARATFTGGTDPGYASGACIENPVYMIEDILRTEAGLDPSETGIDIDVASFDVVGNTTNGTLGTMFGGSAVSLIVYAFCQYQFTTAWELCQELARACGCLLFFSGDGKIKIAPRLRDSSYTSADATIDYNNLKGVAPDITPLAEVRNVTYVKYNYDYANDALLETTAVATDTTSSGNGANGINQTQEIIQDNRFIISGTVAGVFRDNLKNWLAYRKKLLSFDVTTPKHNNLEIGDTVLFSNWPTTFKIYGNTITSTDIYMITKINKKPNGCSITCQEVSEVTD